MYLAPSTLPITNLFVADRQCNYYAASHYDKIIMSTTTCQASSDILAFNDEDIVNIRRTDTTNKVLERNIDIGL
jgi:hypothetical protein